MSFVLSFTLFSIAFVNLSAFNLESRIPVIKKGKSDSYFGFSVAEHQIINEVTRDINKSCLLIGAPLDQNLQPNTTKSGALWQCPITTYYDDCIQVITDGMLSGGKKYKNKSSEAVDSKQLMPPLTDEIKDGQWMGVTVRSQKPGGKVIVCAHRYIHKGDEFQWGLGLCYILTQYLDFEDASKPCQGRPDGRAHEAYGYCQAGTSAIILDDDAAVIGAPGVYTWRGTLYVVDVADFMARDHTVISGPHNETNSPVDMYSYLGMSVTGGHFFSPDYMSYASGAPRAGGTGTVVLFTKFKRQTTMRVDLVVPGEQFASSFGYEVASADLNGDGLPELIVGAPFYFSREEGGAVYIYYNENYALTRSPPQKLTGTLESRFGFAIANLGDINLDSFEDLAVGAPYEDAGVVYIYLGSAQGLIKEPSQVIKGQQVATGPRTFGYSLSGGRDMDGNGYPDLLVGAYDAASVFLFRARPIINITTEVTPENALRNIDPTQRGCEGDRGSEYTCFAFKACCNVIQTSTDSLRVLHRLEAETFQTGKKFSRVWLGRDNSTRPSFVTKEIVLRREARGGPLRHCQDHIVYIKENTKDIQSPIKMKLSYTLVQQEPNPPKAGDPLPSLDQFPILNMKEAAKIVEANFQKDCGDDDVCQSDLQTRVVLDLPRGERDNEWVLMLGTSDDLLMNVSIDNHGESAYEAQFFVFHPATVSYNRIESESKLVFCQSHNKTVVSCQVGNPFKNDSAVRFRVKFDVKQIGDAETKLRFVVFTNSTSQEENITGPLALHADVVKKAELSLKGSARPEQVFYGGFIKGESAMKFRDDIGTRVVHTYQAYNAGPWRVRNLVITITWPTQVANNREQGKWLLYIDEYPTVEALGGGKCYVPQAYINPLMLESRPGLTDHLNPIEMDSDPENSTMAELRSWNNLRRKRELKVRSERVYDSEGRAHSVVNFNCINGTAKCINFKCEVYNLHSGQEALVRVTARLWNATLVEDYARVSYATVSSRAELSLADQQLLQNRADDVADVTTFAYPDLLDVESEQAPLWVIIVAVVCGILLLLLIVLMLWKLGFFKRNRPDPTLTGNIQKSSQDAL